MTENAQLLFDIEVDWYIYVCINDDFCVCYADILLNLMTCVWYWVRCMYTWWFPELPKCYECYNYSSLGSPQKVTNQS